MAKGGYYTNGTTVCTAAGEPHLFHGVDRPSFEWSTQGQAIGISDFEAMASWHANVVRIALNQDFWLAGAALYDPAYQDRIDRAVHYAEAAGLDVILDLHWSDQGNLAARDSGGDHDKSSSSSQQPMADVNSKQFWIEVATKYRDDGHVLFELYNEPHNISWAVWLNGGNAAGFNFQAVGMQELYDAVRATGADNLVIAGGLSYAFDLSAVGRAPISGYNVMYATHPYFPQNPISAWEDRFGYLATHDIAPVIVSEFGDHTTNCTGAWNTQLIEFSDAHHISWTAWAWFAVNDTCSFPALISDWSYTPTVQGEVVKSALLGYPWPTPVPVEPSAGAAGAGGSAGAAGAADGGAAAGEAAGATGAAGAGGSEL